MRRFCITYAVPERCACCQSPLPVPPGGASPGIYSLKIPEGANTTKLRIAEVMEVSLGGGRLEVRLRQQRGSNREWCLIPLHDQEAFQLAGSTVDFVPGCTDYHWYKFAFVLLEFKPTIDTWWAELEFVEAPAGQRQQYSRPLPAPNTSSLKVRLLALG